MSSFQVYLSVYKAALLQKMEYRVDLALGVVTAMMLRLSSLAFLLVVLHQAPSLSGWTGSQVLFLSGLTAMTLGFSELFFNNVWTVPYYIVMGDMDRLLVYPVKTLLFLLISSPVVHAFGNLLVGAALAFGALAYNHVPLDQWLWVPVWAICGCLIYTSCLVIAASLSFKFVGPYSHNLFFVHQLLSANQYPLSIYPAWLEMTLTILFPFAAAIYLPSGWIFGTFLNPWCALAGPAAAALLVFLAFKAWDWGLKQYESTGS
jgi:ABC-2 type transport system permease protein